MLVGWWGGGRVPRPRPSTLTVLSALIVVGCGAQTSQRPAVARYVTQAGRIETALAAPLATVARAGARFAQDQSVRGKPVAQLTDAADERGLLQAFTEIESLRARLATLPAPAPAVRLRTLLLELVDLQASATHEVATLVAFEPRFASALEPLGPATRRLEAALRQPPGGSDAAAVAAAYTARAAALRRFRATTNQVLARLRRLRPPAVSKPGYRAQIAALTGMGTNAGRLARSLARAAQGSGTQGNIERLLIDFDRAAVSTQTVGVQKAQIASIRAYDAQSQQMTALSAKVDQERLLLADTLQ